MLLSLEKQIHPPITSAGFAAGGSVLDYRFEEGDAYTFGVEEECRGVRFSSGWYARRQACSRREGLDGPVRLRTGACLVDSRPVLSEMHGAGRCV
jgi:hypothetical protein